MQHFIQSLVFGISLLFSIFLIDARKIDYINKEYNPSKFSVISLIISVLGWTLFYMMSL